MKRISEAYDKIEEIINKTQNGFCHSASDKRKEKLAEDEMVLLAEYSLDFAMQATNNTLLILMKEMRLQLEDERRKSDLQKKIFTIPNILSVFRIILAVLFLEIDFKWGMDEKRTILIGILIISGFSDFLDGKIARKFNMVSELGKILDPIADKLTQAVLLFCFIYKYETAKYILILFLFKEIYVGAMGLKTIATIGKNEGAMWYGKISTAFFYTVMAILFLFPQIPKFIAEILIIGYGIMLIMAGTLYTKHFIYLQKYAETKKKQSNDRV